MQGLRIVEIRSDDDAVAHAAAHGIRIAEVAEVVWNRHIVRTNPRAPRRITVIGETNAGRVVEVALDPTADEGTWLLVTALDASEAGRELLRRTAR